MVVIVTLGLVFAVLATFALFVLMFIDVAFKPPQASMNRSSLGKVESSPRFADSVVRSHEHIQQADPRRCVEQSAIAAGRTFGTLASRSRDCCCRGTPVICESCLS